MPVILPIGSILGSVSIRPGTDNCLVTCHQLEHIHVGTNQEPDPENHRCNHVRHRPTRGEPADRAGEGGGEDRGMSAAKIAGASIHRIESGVLPRYCHKRCAAWPYSLPVFHKQCSTFNERQPASDFALMCGADFAGLGGMIECQKMGNGRNGNEMMGMHEGLAVGTGRECQNGAGLCQQMVGVCASGRPIDFDAWDKLA